MAPAATLSLGETLISTCLDHVAAAVNFFRLLTPTPLWPLRRGLRLHLMLRHLTGYTSLCLFWYKLAWRIGEPPAHPKLCVWIGSSLEDLKEFPERVQDMFGYALQVAQMGEKHVHAKPMKGFKGAGMLEIVEDFDGETYRAVYTVKLAGRVHVLHAFQKKAKKGIATPQADIDLIKTRLKWATDEHAEWIRASKESRKR